MEKYFDEMIDYLFQNSPKVIETSIKEISEKSFKDLEDNIDDLLEELNYLYSKIPYEIQLKLLDVLMERR